MSNADMPYFDNTLSYDERIAQRKEVEDALWAKIQAAIPWVINITTAEQDMKGIDATFERLKDDRLCKKQTVQLKMREYGGNDILMEMIRPWEGMKTVDNLVWNGRNSKMVVDKYFCVDTKNELRIIDGSYLRDTAQKMVLKFIEAYKRNQKIRTLKVFEGEIKVILEPSAEASFKLGKVDKLAVFIIPSKIKVSYLVQL